MCILFPDSNNYDMFLFLGKVVLTKSALGKTIGVLDVGSEVEAVSFCKENSLGFLAVGKEMT